MNFQVAPRLRFVISSGSKEKEPRYVCRSEAKASHLHRMWTEVSSSVPHFLRVGLLNNPIKWRCFLRVLCPVRRPVTTLDFVLLKDSNLVFEVGLGPEINFRACLWVLPGPRHIPKCWLSTQLLIFFFNILPRDPQGRFRSYKLLNRTARCEVNGDFISSYPSMSRDPVQPHNLPGTDITERLLALLYQLRRCCGNLKCFQSRLTSSLRTTGTRYRRLCTARSLIFNIFPFLKGIAVKFHSYIVHSYEAKTVYV
jgi:hypothetical protein